jgi:hypothetical protein
MKASDKDCEDYARDCVRLAWQTNDEAIRTELLAMAREWMESALREPQAGKPKATLG